MQQGNVEPSKWTKVHLIMALLVENCLTSDLDQLEHFEVHRAKLQGIVLVYHLSQRQCVELVGERFCKRQSFSSLNVSVADELTSLALF